MKFLRVDAFGDNHPCKRSRIDGDLQTKLDRLLPRSVSKQLLRLVMARIHMYDKVSGATIDWRSIHNRALRQLWDDIDVWQALEKELQALTTAPLACRSLIAQLQSWPRKYNQTDRYRQRVHDRATAENVFLERMPKATSTWLVDKIEKITQLRKGALLAARKLRQKPRENERRVGTSMKTGRQFTCRGSGDRVWEGDEEEPQISWRMYASYINDNGYRLAKQP